MYEREVLKTKKRDGGYKVVAYRYAMLACATDVRYVYFVGRDSDIDDPRMLEHLDAEPEKRFVEYCDMLRDMIDLGKLGFRVIGSTVWSE